MSKNKKTVIILLIIAALIAIIPIFALPGAEFGGSDDAGSQVVQEISPDYEPWARRGRKPVFLHSDRHRRGHHRFLYRPFL